VAADTHRRASEEFKRLTRGRSSERRRG
jgi:hypothetical protein